MHIVRYNYGITVKCMASWNMLIEKQVDILPSKNQALCVLPNGKSCEQEWRLITIKEHIAMYTNLTVLFKSLVATFVI